MPPPGQRKSPSPYRLVYNSRVIDYSGLGGFVSIGGRSWQMNVTRFLGQAEGFVTFTGGACGTGTPSETVRCPMTEVTLSNVADPYSASTATFDEKVGEGSASVSYPSRKGTRTRNTLRG